MSVIKRIDCSSPFILTFLSVLLKDVAIFGRCDFFLWSLSAFRVIVSNDKRACLPSSVDVRNIFSIFDNKITDWCYLKKTPLTFKQQKLI